MYPLRLPRFKLRNFRLVGIHAVQMVAEESAVDAEEEEPWRP